MGEVIAIVGAGPGLGAAMAQRFAREGWGIGLIARDQSVLDTGRSELEDSGAAVATALADVGDEEAVDRGLRSIHAELGGLRMVVYNASIFQAEPALELSTDALVLALRIHVLGALNTAKSAVPLMQERDRGIITFTINCLALHPEAASTALSIGKGAQHNLALSLEQELADTGIRVAVVTITRPIAAGTAFDAASIAETYWRISQQDPERFERDHVFDG